MFNNMTTPTFLFRPPIQIGISLFFLLIASFLWMSNSNSPTKEDRPSKSKQLTAAALTSLNIKGAFNGDTLRFSQTKLPTYLHPNADCIGKKTMGKFASNIPDFWSAINTSTIPKGVSPGYYDLEYILSLIHI